VGNLTGFQDINHRLSTVLMSASTVPFFFLSYYLPLFTSVLKQSIFMFWITKCSLGMPCLSAVCFSLYSFIRVDEVCYERPLLNVFVGIFIRLGLEELNKLFT